MLVLTFGSSGQLGQELARADWGPGVTQVQLGREVADLADPNSLRRAINSNRPDLVVIAAAYTAVDRAEAEEEFAARVNGIGPGVIAEAAAKIGAPVVHVSTDYVFDGSKPIPYTEDDPVAPLGAYGRTKEAGERAVREANPQHAILRTAWVYSPFGANFVKTMLRLAGERDAVSVVEDQVGCPTAAGDLARAIVLVSRRLLADPSVAGTYNAAGSAATSWHGFAEAIFSSLAARGRKRPVNTGIPTSAYPTPARRPANSRLDGSRLQDVFGITLPPYTAALPLVLDELLGPDNARIS
jgi:dTDP-4-dehydrorhamnose reductase